MIVILCLAVLIAGAGSPAAAAVTVNEGGHTLANIQIQVYNDAMK